MNFISKEPINKGWSSDKRYCVTDENGTRYLLRVSDIAQLDTKQSEFNTMEQVMSGYSDTEQYVYGLEAGRILRKIHSIAAPATQEDWENRHLLKDRPRVYQHGDYHIGNMMIERNG